MVDSYTMKFLPLLKLSLFCVLAAVLNYIVSVFCLYVLKTPLFVDTVFTVAVTFTAGLVPGLVTALLTSLIGEIMVNSLSPFVLCAFAEIFIVWLFTRKKRGAQDNSQLKQCAQLKQRAQLKQSAAVSGILIKLMMLYITACFAVSILGGVIEYIYHSVLAAPKLFFSAEDMFKIGFLKGDIHILGVNILSRIPVNLVDRFIVIFGGYFISIPVKKILKEGGGKSSKNIRH